MLNRNLARMAEASLVDPYRHAQTVKNGASSHKTNYIDILNLVGHLNRCIGTKVTAILLNGWILPNGGVAQQACYRCNRLNECISRNRIFTHSLTHSLRPSKLIPSDIVYIV